MKIILPILAIFITSCSDINNNGATTSFTNKTLAENTEKTTLLQQIPVAQNQHNQDLADSINSNIAAFKKELEPQAQDTLGRFEAYMTWAAAVNSQVTQLTLQSYLFTGGAHGATVVATTLYDNANALKISPLVLFSDTTRFLQFVSDHITADSIPLFEQYAKQLPMPANIILDSVSVTALYNQYEIAPYSSGVIQVSVPYKNLGETFDTTYIHPTSLKEIRCPAE